MRAMLKALARPWRAAVAVLRRPLDLQRATAAEVREMHRSHLLAAIYLIEEQRQAREALAQECARLERRLAAVEAELAAARAAK